MKPKPHHPILILPQFIAMTPDDLRHHAAASGQEVWEQVGAADAYACSDFPGLVLTREAARARPRTFLMHTSGDAILGSGSDA
jgi:hypothetical protein